MNAGQRVTPSGQGRTATWPKIKGTITRTTKRAVFVQWDGTAFEDEMEPGELAQVTPTPTPYDMGRQFYQAGQPLAPAMDRSFVDAYLIGPPGGKFAILNEWQRGWIDASLAEPVEDTAP